MPERYLFRQVFYLDLRIFARNRELRAKNHPEPQACHQTSYVELVERRGTEEFRMPCGGVVNDYVPFYFSPFTAFCFTIFRGNVDLRSPDGCVLGKATQDDRAFVVYKAADLIAEAELETYFSNTALNNMSIEIVFGASQEELAQIVSWPLFDEAPTAGQITEIGYGGSCRYFHNRAEPEHHQDRSSRRMAEFLVKDAVPLDLAACVLAANEARRTEIEAMLRAEGCELPVLCKPGCFF